MSSFTVAVVTDNNTTVEELLKLYSVYEKVQKVVLKTKEDIIYEEKENIKKYIKMKENVLDTFKINKADKVVLESGLKYLKGLLKLKDEDIYKKAIKKYDCNLISKEGSLIGYWNPYCKWRYYDKNSEYTKLIVIDNKEGKPIYTNTAKYGDIIWNMLDYKAIFTDATLFPDGTWYDEELGTTTKINKKTNGQIEYEVSASKNTRLDVDKNNQITIVECFI